MKHDQWCEAVRSRATGVPPEVMTPCACAERAYIEDPFIEDGQPVRREFNR